jgi:hypothetical protein
MSRKDYEAVASLLARLRTEDYDRQTLHEVAEGLADIFENDNPQFSRYRFITATRAAK